MLIPSFELMAGKAVQLRRGREKAFEREDVLEIAREYGRFGEIAVFDVDAALGKGDNEDLIKQLVKVAACRVGGGIRDEDKARRLLRAGAEKVIIGTAASRELLTRLPRKHLMVAIDSIDGDVVTHGWSLRTGCKPMERLQAFSPYAGGFLCTFVERKGTMTGLPFDRIMGLRELTEVPLTVAGGTSCVDEVAKLDREGVDVQVGTALFSGRFAPADAFLGCMDFSKGPVPTVVLNQKGKILMLAHSTHESLKRSLETGRGIYWSRSRREAYEKGEPSGNNQVLIRVYVDCDRDALVFVVNQSGFTCHRGTGSCFDGLGNSFDLFTLYDDVLSKRLDPRPSSYTSYLFERDDRIPRKIHEEVFELLHARNKDDLIWEAGDVFYFLLAYLVKNDVTLEDVIRELRGRQR